MDIATSLVKLDVLISVETRVPDAQLLSIRLFIYQGIGHMRSQIVLC